MIYLVMAIGKILHYTLGATLRLFQHVECHAILLESEVVKDAVDNKFLIRHWQCRETKQDYYTMDIHSNQGYWEPQFQCGGCSKWFAPHLRESEIDRDKRLKKNG